MEETNSNFEVPKFELIQIPEGSEYGNLVHSIQMSNLAIQDFQTKMDTYKYLVENPGTHIEEWIDEWCESLDLMIQDGTITEDYLQSKWFFEPIGENILQSICRIVNSIQNSSNEQCELFRRAAKEFTEYGFKKSREMSKKFLLEASQHASLIKQVSTEVLFSSNQFESGQDVNTTVDELIGESINDMNEYVFNLSQELVSSIDSACQEYSELEEERATSLKDETDKMCLELVKAAKKWSLDFFSNIKNDEFNQYSTPTYRRIDNDPTKDFIRDENGRIKKFYEPYDKDYIFDQLFWKWVHDENGNKIDILAGYVPQARSEQMQSRGLISSAVAAVKSKAQSAAAMAKSAVTAAAGAAKNIASKGVQALKDNAMNIKQSVDKFNEASNNIANGIINKVKDAAKAVKDKVKEITGNEDDAKKVDEAKDNVNEKAEEAKSETPSTPKPIVMIHDPFPDEIAAAAAQGTPITVMNPYSGNKTYNPDGSVTKDNNFTGDKVTTFPDGTTTTESPDGTKKIESPDGTTTTESPDGYSVSKKPDGTVVGKTPDGVETTNRPDGTTSTKHPDGTVIEESPEYDGDGNPKKNPDGSPVKTVTKIDPDGTVTTKTPDGVTKIKKPDNTECVKNPDGTSVTVLPDGTKITQRPDGTSLRENPDGSQVKVEPIMGQDGKPKVDENGNPLSRVTTIDPDGFPEEKEIPVPKSEPTEGIPDYPLGADGNLMDANGNPINPDGSPVMPSTYQDGPQDKVGGVQLKGDKHIDYAWKSQSSEFVDGLGAMMHDGDQLFFNPYGKNDDGYTVYSFRPKDRNDHFPNISITPSSFEALDSMDAMLDSVPYVVIKEYFFKNASDTMMNLVKKLWDMAKDAVSSPGGDKQPDGNAQAAEKDSKGASDAKVTGDSILDKIKDKFQAVSLKMQVIDIPYILYCGLRKRLYANTYIFPYIVSDSTVINKADNTGEWNGDTGGASIVGMFKEAVNAAAAAVGGLASAVTGSMARTANLFPAPVWGGPGNDKVEFSFDLMLINDHIVKSRNNYMCVNTIIHNNRSIQKAMLAFPGALYELWLPTGQRHLMCTASFQLYPLGLNRKSPKGFFTQGDVPGADFPIGSTNHAKMLTPHVDEEEVIPDGYKLSCTFKSCLANNMNTAVFQYYIEMAPYGKYRGKPPGNPDEVADRVAAEFTGGGSKPSGGDGPQTTGGTTPSTTGISRIYSAQVRDLVDDDDPIEKFDESTYNKSLSKLKSSMGEMAINADGVVGVIRSTQKIIRESTEFLSKLYNAKNNNLWYKPFEQEEYYTTIKPDYRQALRKRYGEKFNELRGVEDKLNEEKHNLDLINEELQNDIIDLDARDASLAKKVSINKNINDLQGRRTQIVDEMLQIDTDMIQYAFDVYDDTVSVKKRNINGKIFQQVWNEKIMNSYEKEKIKYMTSKEKQIYFQDKIRELERYDEHGILNHRDWFFRVTVLDFVVAEMRNLVSWFKNCTYEDFETVYKIVRKLNLLKMDIDQIYSTDKFDINRTNLFYINEDSIRDYTKLDAMLNGNSLYDLFQSQMVFRIVDVSNTTNEPSNTSKPIKDRELLREQKSELDNEKRRTIRQDVVVRYWGSESALTKAAYDYINNKSASDACVQSGVGNEYETRFNELKLLKETIIRLKLNGGDDNELREALGSFANNVSIIKEAMVMSKMNEMNLKGNEEMKSRDDDVNAKVSK